MEKLTRHSLYTALFLGTLLTVAGLGLYPEFSTLTVLITVLVIMAGIFLLAWLFVRMTTPPRLDPHGSAPPQPHNVPEGLEVH